MKKILVIDDNHDILFALSEIITFKGWQPFIAQTIREGLKVFESEMIDLIIVDYHMPKINGLAGVTLFRQRSLSVPILVLTVEESQEIADKFINAGASDFALKPIKAPDLLSRLQVHLNAGASVLSKENYQRYTKGISSSTMKIIEEFMKRTPRGMFLKEISEETSLSYQTVHRYLNHLVKYNVVKAKYIYGKVGRPKQKYFWRS